MKQAKALLLHSAGTYVKDIFENLADPGHPHGVSKITLMTMKSPFVPWMHTFSPQPMNRMRDIFHHIRQHGNETVDQFVDRLRKQGQNCGNGTELNDHIRDQVVDWCKSMPIRRNLLGKGSKLNFQLAQQIARTMEPVDLQLTAMNMGMTQSRQSRR